LSNGRVRQTKIAAAVNVLGKVVEPFREDRNLFVHRGTMPIMRNVAGLAKNKVDMLFMMSRISSGSSSTPAFSRRFLSRAFNLYARIVSEDIDGQLGKLGESVSLLFDSLMPVYTSTRSTLQVPNIIVRELSSRGREGSTSSGDSKDSSQ